MGVKKYPLIDLFTGNPPPEEVIQALVGLLKLVISTKGDFTGLRLPVEEVSSEERSGPVSWFYLPPGQILTARSTDRCWLNKLSFKQPVLLRVEVKKDETETVILRLIVWDFDNSLGHGSFGKIYPCQESRLLVCTGQPPQWQTTSTTSEKIIKVFSRQTGGTKYSPTSRSGNTRKNVFRRSKSLEFSQLYRVKHLEAENLYVEMVPKGLLNRKHPGPDRNMYDHFLDYGAVVMKRFHGISLRDYLDGKNNSWTLVERLQFCLSIVKAYLEQVFHLRVRSSGAEVPVSHCDISLQNILCLRKGGLVFIDFGAMVPWGKLVGSGFSAYFSPPEVWRFDELCHQEGVHQERFPPHTIGDVVSFSFTPELDPIDPLELPEPISEPARSSLTRARTDGVDRSSSAVSNSECDDAAQRSSCDLSSRFFFRGDTDEVAPGEKSPNSTELELSSTIDCKTDSLPSPGNPVTPEVDILPEAAADSDSNRGPDFDSDAPEALNHVDIYALGRVFLFILNGWWKLEPVQYKTFFPMIKGHHRNRTIYETYHLKHNQVSVSREFLDFSSNIQAILDAMLCYVAEERCPLQWVIERLEGLIQEMMERENRPQNTYSFFRPDRPPPPTDNRGLADDFSSELFGEFV